MLGFGDTDGDEVVLPDDCENTGSTYSKGDWVMVSYNDVKILSGIIVDYDEKEDKYCVTSMVYGASGFYFWPCNCDALHLA